MLGAGHRIFKSVAEAMFYMTLSFKSGCASVQEFPMFSFLRCYVRRQETLHFACGCKKWGVQILERVSQKTSR